MFNFIKRFFKRKEEPLPLPPAEPSLPQEFEKFRVSNVREPVIEQSSPAPIRATEEFGERNEMDRYELILQRLETIDTRLKLIEEKLEKARL